MRRFSSYLQFLCTGSVVCVGLALTADVALAQSGRDRSDEGRERGGPGGGQGRGGFGGRPFGFGGGEPSLSRELSRETFAEKIKLTEEQKQLMNDLDMQRREFFRSQPRGNGGPGTEDFEKRMQDMQAKMKEFEGKALEILTADQKAIWEERRAEIKAEQEARGDRPDMGRSRGDSSSSSTTPAVPPTQSRRTVFTDEKPPEGATATASFAARPAKSTASGDSDVAATGASGGGAAAGKGDEATLSFNFRYAPWADVLKLFADAANLTLDLNDTPPGTFNYYDDKSYTVTEAMDVLNGYLLPKGYVLIRRNRFLVSLNIDNGIPPSLLPTITVDELPKRGANELVIVDVPLEGFEADKIVGEVKELVGPWGKVAAMKNTNSLNIMDTGSNISRIVRLLKAGAPIGDKETAFRSIALKHISSADAERTVRRLFGLNPAVTTTTQPQFGFQQFGGGGGFPQFGGFNGFRGGDDRNRGGDDRNRGGDFQRPQSMAASPSTPSAYAGKIQVTADPRTNHLLIAASASLVKVVEDVVKSIDVDTGEKVTDAGPAYLKAYVVAGSDAAQVAQTLNSVMPGLVVGQDTRSGKIHVQATREEHAQIERLIQTLAGEASGSVAVINLTKSDPIQVTNTLRNLFANEPKAPTIEADALGRRLLIRGSADQLAQVKILLQNLGEAGVNPQDESAKVDRGPVRTMNLGGRDPQDVLPLIQKMWDAGQRNPIRVVVPSQPNPIRDRRVPGGGSYDSGAGEPTTRESAPAESARPTSRKTVPERTSPSAQAPRRSSILQVSQSGEGRGDEEPRSTLKTSRTDINTEADDDQQAPAGNQPAVKEGDGAEAGSKQTSGSKAPISMSIVGDDVIISSPDKEALDQLEDMFNTLASALPVRTRWTVFYLRSADATDTAQMLERLFPQSSVTASTTSSSGMFGSLTGGLSNIGRGMMNVTGLNQTLGGANDLRIITDIRSNALFVTGPQDQIAEIESMLELLDSSDLPGSLRDRVPRTIPIEHADVDEVADIVESVFKDALTPDNQQQGQQGQRFNPLAMLMGGAGGGGGGARKEPGVQLTIGVDRRTSHLVVACNDNLFRQIEGLVKSIDERALDARQTVKIMHLETADPSLVSATLTSLIPKVTISASRGSTRKKQPGQNDPAQAQGGQSPDAVRDPDLIRRTMEQRRNQMTPGTGRQNFGGGRQNFGGGGGNRQNFGGGGARPNFGGGGGARGRGDR